MKMPTETNLRGKTAHELDSLILARDTIEGTSLVQFDLLTIFHGETIEITEISHKSGVKWTEKPNIVYHSRKSFEINRNTGPHATIFQTMKSIETFGKTQITADISDEEEFHMPNS